MGDDDDESDDGQYDAEIADNPAIKAWQIRLP